MPQFWILKHPEYNSDYQDFRTNGQLAHPFGLPGITCAACGNTWSSTRVLPVPCPEELRDLKHIQNGWPISAEEHEALRELVVSRLQACGYKVDPLLPGDDFQPGYLEVPSFPTADFLWSSLASVVVSARIKVLCEEKGFSGVQFCPVLISRVGKRKARGRPPIPTTGEPEDMIDEVPLEKDTTLVGPYWEMVITAQSGRPKGAEIISTCKSCGREEYDDSKRMLIMNPDMWRGDDIFHLATTLHIVVSERVKQALENIRATGVRFASRVQ